MKERKPEPYQYGTRSQGICPTVTPASLQLPTLEADQQFFESRLRKGQCPHALRKTDGDCPFYFVGGYCADCNVRHVFCSTIVDAWSRAIEERRKSLIEASKGRPA